MTWTNAFDAGTCTVEVARATTPNTTTWSGVLAKGGSHAFTDGTYSLSVAVSASGVVTLNNENGLGIEDNMLVAVVPSYALTGYDGARVTGANTATSLGVAGATSDRTFGTDFDATSGAQTVDLTAQTPYAQIFVATAMLSSSTVTPIVQFTPEFATLDVVVAPDESMVVAQGSLDNVVAPVIALNGTPTAADSLSIDAGPAHGTVSVSGTSLLYTPDAGYSGADSIDYYATINGTDSNVATVSITVRTSYNCDCDDDHPTETLVNLRKYLMVRLGFAAMLSSPPPGMTDLLNSFLIDAQTLLYRQFRMLRLERWFTWNMVAGVRFYDLPDNVDTCTKKLDPGRVRWVGISQGDASWRPLVCGIDPVRYSYSGSSVPDAYEIHQCIEVFPAPADDTWKLRIKGDFGLLAFAADSDVTTIDPEAIKMHALAYAKAHYSQPDAGNYMTALQQFLGDLTAETHLTRRYVPGERIAPPAIRPKMVD